MSLKTEQRAKKILQVLLQHGNASVDELVGSLGASAPSIRRDLARLEARNLVHRTHGGARLAGQMQYEPFRFDSSFHVRESRFAEEKRRIGMAAAELIREHDTVGFTAGTTPTQVARCIRHRNSIHIITNAVNIAMELSNQPALNVTLTGGTMRWAGAFSLTGPTAHGDAERSVHGQGVHWSVRDGCETRRDDDRTGRGSGVSRDGSPGEAGDCGCRLEQDWDAEPGADLPGGEIDILVTDSGIAADAREAFRANDIEVLAV